MSQATDATLRLLERMLVSGEVPMIVLVRARARRGLSLFDPPAWDPRENPRPGNKVRGASANVLRLVVEPTEPVLAVGRTPWVPKPRYCVGKPWPPTRPSMRQSLQPHEPREILLPEVDPGTGEEPGYQLGSLVAHHGGFLVDDHNQVVHWRRVEGRGRRSGCMLLTSWRNWAKDGEVVW